MDNKPLISFDEFKQLCETAGVMGDNNAQMEDDYHINLTIMEAVVETHALTEPKKEKAPANVVEAFEEIDLRMNDLWDAIRDSKMGDIRTMGLECVAKLVVMISRFARHDEGKN